MIQINLLPGAGRKTRGRAPTASVGAALSGALSSVKDPLLVGAVASVAVSVAAVALMFTTQNARAASLEGRQTKAVADSARFAVVLGDRRKAEARRDSVQRQLAVIKAIDNNRFVWPHVMDEVSRALPPYTWLTSIVQTSAPPAPSDLPAKGDSATAKKGKAAIDSLPVDNMKFRLVGNTVDIQALTRFMKLLEASPFVQNVTLAKSDLVQMEGNGVTQFTLDCEYQQPDSGAIRTVPVSFLVK